MPDQKYCECDDALAEARKGFRVLGDLDDHIGDTEQREEDERVFREHAETAMLEDQLNGVCGWCGFPIRPADERARSSS